MYLPPGYMLAECVPCGVYEKVTRKVPSAPSAAAHVIHQVPHCVQKSFWGSIRSMGVWFYRE
jgi:hypothetical protein